MSLSVLLLQVAQSPSAGTLESASFRSRPSDYGQAGGGTQSTTFADTGSVQDGGRGEASSASYEDRAGFNAALPAPSRITDLALLDRTTDAIRLRWTAPAADVERSTGTAVRYLIRYSSTAILSSDSAFASATDAGDAAQPLGPGQLETRWVTGLAPNTTWSIALEAVNEHGVRGDLSVAVTSTTLSSAVAGAAVYAVFPTSLTVNWLALPASPSSSTSEGYLLQASTASDFTGTLFSSATPNAALSTLTIQGLVSRTTYYLRVGSLAWDAFPNFAAAGSTLTARDAAPVAPVLLALHVSSAAVGYGLVGSDGYVVEAATAADFSGAVRSSATAVPTLDALTVQGLDPNTTYYLRAGALWDQTTAYAPAVPASTSTLAGLVGGAQFAAVYSASVTVDWVGLPLSPPDASSKTAEGYLLQASTAADFSGALLSSATPNAGLSTLTVSGLNEFTTYYFRVGALNWNAVPRYAAAGTTRTAAGPPPGSPVVSQVFVSSISASWTSVASDDGYVLEASTASDFSGTLFSSATPNGAAASLVVPGLASETAYFLRAGSLWSGATSYAATSPASTTTLVNQLQSTPFYPGNGSYVGIQPNFSWRGPSTATLSGLGAGTSYYLEVDDDQGFGSLTISISTPVILQSANVRTDDATYVSTFTLASGSTYYWRVRVRSGLDGTFSSWSQTYSFVTDLAAPASQAGSFSSQGSTGGFQGEAQWNDFLSGTTVQLKVQDVLAGLLKSTSSLPDNLPFPPGGFGVSYSTSAGQSWVQLSSSVSRNDANFETVFALGTFQDRLYAGFGQSPGEGDIYVCAPGADGVCDPGDWSLSYNGAQERFNSFAAFNGKLYAGQGLDAAGDGDIYVCSPGGDGVCDPGDWSLSYNGSKELIHALAVYNGKLYAGQGTSAGAGDVLVCDPSLSGDAQTCEAGDWSLSFDGGSNLITSLAEYNGRLFAGQALSSGAGDVYVFDGSSWIRSYDGSFDFIFSLAAFDGKLFAAQGNTPAGAGDVLAYDGNSWTTSFDGGSQEAIISLAVHNGRLYAGAGDSAGDGDVLGFDGSTWTLAMNGGATVIQSLSAFNGRLYAGQGSSTGDGDIYALSPFTVALTGSDGSTALETLSATGLSLVSSTNTQTCAGAFPCGATNQVIFTAMDKAGRVLRAGPYAVLMDALTPTAVSTPSYPGNGTYVDLQPNFAWVGPSTVTAAALGAGASYILEVDDSSDFSSLVVSISTPVILQSANVKTDDATYVSTFTLASGTTYFWRVRARNGVNGNYSPWSSTYAFVTDFVLPVAQAGSFGSVSSTAGVLGETQWNDFLSGTTVQLKVQDVLAGLLKSTSSLPDNLPFPPGGFGISYSTNAGQTRVYHTGSVSYDGAGNRNRALAVFNGRLYVGLGETAGSGDVVVCSPAASGLADACEPGDWTVSFNGAQEQAPALAVHDGKLYVGQGINPGDGDVLVCSPGADGLCDPGDWSVSYDGAQQGVYSLASYNGKLYAGEYGSGDILVYDGNSWSQSYVGPQESFWSLAAYNGRLYAGQGHTGGDGDVLVFDGSSWSLAYDGAASIVTSLAVHGGKLYAGTEAGGGELYSYDGASWSVAYDGNSNIYGLASANGKLYAAQADGKVVEFDGAAWNAVYDGPQALNGLAAFGGRLYTGEGLSSGDVIMLTPPSVALTGADGSLSLETLSATGLSLVSSTNTQTCAGAFPCGATNQVIFNMMDKAGRVLKAGPYAVLVDTTPAPVPIGPANGAFVSTTTPSLAWSTTTAGAHVVQLALDAAFSQVVADSTTLNASYISTNTLVHGTTYWWRARPVAGLSQFNWSAARTFTVDVVSPVFSVPQVATNSASPSWIALPTQTYLSTTAVSVRIQVQDPLAGLMVTTGLPAGLVAQWHFDESSGTVALDASTMAHHGTISGAPAWSSGRRGSALSFDGTDDYIDLGSTSDMKFSATDKFTVEAWINPALGSQDDVIIGNGWNTAGYHLRVTSGNKLRFIVVTNGATFKFSESQVLTPGWHHVAGVWDGAEVWTFVDGRLDSSKTNSGTLGSITSGLNLQAGNIAGQSLYFNGAIDEVRVFNVARSSAQILADFQADQLSAQALSEAYHVLYSTTAGASWSFVSTANVTLSGTNGTTASQTLQADGIRLVTSTGPGAVTNQIAVVAQDFAGNVSTAVYTVLVDTAACSTRTSTQDGPWSDGTTWSPNAVPTSCSPVVVAAGHTVTLDVMTAVSSGATLSGTLKASRSVSSSWTVTSGDVNVMPGGHLDLGTEADPIPTAVQAHVVLASGTFGGQYGLIVQNGGDFTVRGSTKWPWGYATESITGARTSLKIAASSATGWAAGDSITIGPTSGQGPSTVQERVITSITGTDPLTLSWATGLSADRILTSTAPIVVANLTRNVLVRSSGTVVDGAGANSAYVRNLAQNATSFALAHGELAYMGANVTPKYGALNFDGAAVRGSISSSTVRNAFTGIWLNGTSAGVSLRANNVYAGADSGIFMDGGGGADIIANSVHGYSYVGIGFDAASAGNFVTLNQSYSNGENGFHLTGDSDRNVLSSNRAFANVNRGFLAWSQSSDNVFVGNQSYSNNRGFYFDGSDDNVLVSNDGYANGNQAFWLDTAFNNVLIDNFGHSNANNTLYLRLGASSNTWVGGGLGYMRPGVSAPDSGGPELAFELGAPAEVLTLKGARVNPAGWTFNDADYDTLGSAVISYNQDYSTGSVHLRGDYAVSGATWTLDYASRLYASTATVPLLTRGTGHVLTVCSTDDGNALSQLVTVQRAAGAWQVSGSSSGAMGTLTPGGSCPGTGFPSGAAQVALVLTQGGSPTDGDRLDFALLAASPDLNRQKSLLFGAAASTLNQGRTKLTVAPTGGLVLRGKTDGTANTLVDMLPGTTYFTLVSSGVFTAEHSSFTNMDPRGLQLSGSAGVLISSSTFDYLGFASGTNAYITARNLTSQATFYNVTFGLSRSSAGFDSAYNVRVEGSDAGLFWRFRGKSGPLWGEAFDDEAGNRVRWDDAPPPSPVVMQVFRSSVAIAWGPNDPAPDGYVLEASTAADFSGTVLASATSNGAMTGLIVLGLDPNTTYYLRAGSLWSGATSYALTAPQSTSTLANEVAGPQFAGVFATSAAVNWVGLPLSPPDASSKTAEGYLLQASTAADFTGTLFSTATPNAGLSTLTVSGLNEFTTYYFRAGALNWNGVPSFIVAGTTRTRAGLAPASPLIAAVHRSSVSATWGSVASDDGYALEASTAADFSGTVTSSATPNGALTGLVVLGLDPNTTYYLRAGSLWSGATSYALTAPQSTSTLTSEVSGPQFAGVFATSAAVNWVGLPLSPPDASSKTAEGYLLQASTAADFTGTLFSTATPNAALSTLTVSGLNEFTTYYFRVGALNWNGVPSFIVAGTTRTRSGLAPASPLIAAVYRSSVSATWGAVASDDGYVLEASTAADFSGTVLASATPNGALTGLAVSGLDPNTTYYLRAGSLWSGATSYALAAPQSTSTLANEVSGPQFAGVFAASAAVNWVGLPLSPPDASSKTAEGYLLQASTAADFTGTLFSTATPNAALSTLTVSGLNEFTTYYFRVGALNWNGAASFIVAGTTRTRAGLAPASPLIAAVYRSSVSVTWGAVASDDGYVLEASTAADFSGAVASSATPNGALTGLAVLGLDPNTTYYLRAGSLWSGATSYALAAPQSTSTLANEVAGPQFAGVFAASAAVNWVGLPLSPPDASSKTAEGYLLQASTAADFTGALFSSATPNAALSTLTVSGLNEFTTYYFRAGALNWNGVPSFIVAGTTRTRAGLAPASPAVAAVYRSSISVTWGAVASDDGYALEASTAADFSGTVLASATSNGALTGLAVLGLAPNTTYYLRAGSLWSGATSYALTAPPSTSTLANEVTGPQFAGVFATSATVNWVGLPLSPPDASSKTAEGYLLQASTAADFTGTLFSTATPNAALSTLTVSGLNEFTTYYFRAGALNWNGLPSFIAAGSTRTRSGLAPASPILAAVHRSSVSATWGSVASDDGYVLEASTAADFSGTVLASATPNGALTGLAVSGLDPNTTYYLRAGSLWSGATSYALTAPQSTSTLTSEVSGPQFADVFATSATVNWVGLPLSPPDASSKTAEGYLLQASTAANFGGTLYSTKTYNPTLSTLTVMGLGVNVTYYFRVGALNWNSAPNFIAAGSTRTIQSCATVSSAQDGPWTAPATWAGGLLPTECNPVVISHSVTLDTTAAVAAGLTLNGTLSFSRVVNSSLTLVQGNLTVASGGWLDMGAEASPIPEGLTAQLNLAKGEVAGHFGLVVEAGGDFTVRGATKTPYAFASGDAGAGAVTLSVPAAQSVGWAAGDRVAIGKTNRSGADETEERVIDSIGGGDPRAVNWSGGLAYAHYSTGPLVVANLTRNALIRSSGTDTASNTAYVQNLAANATSFAVAYAELAFLGADQAGRYGVTFESGAKGTISSSTLRDGFTGVHLSQSSGVTLSTNVVHGMAGRGIHLAQAAGNVLEANVAASGADDGIRLENVSRWNALRGNRTYSNAGHGVSLVSSRDNVLVGQASYGNQGRGLSFTASSDSNTVVTADLHSNSSHGLYIQNSAGNMAVGSESRYNGAAGAWLSFTQGNWIAQSSLYANAAQGLALEGGSRDAFVDGRLGYDSSGTSRPDASAEVYLNPPTTQDADLKGTRVNPAPGIPAAGFNGERNFLLSYDQDYASGTLRVRGDAVLAAALTLDYAARLYAGQATPPRLKFGAGHSASVSQVYDAEAVTQRVTIVRRGGQWRVDGSSSGPSLASFPGSVSGLDVPASAPQFRLDFSPGGASAEGDAVDFLLVAGSPSSNRQKKLLFEDGAASHRGGRAKLATSAALTLRGTAGFPTLVDRLDGSATYYALVASGPFTAELSSFTNLDPGGLQLSGAGPVAMSTSTFDFMGIAEAVNAYLTARDLASAATFYGLSFGVSRSTVGAPSAYNVRVEGGAPGLRWLLKKWDGPLAGEATDDDASDRVRWAPFVPAAAVPPFGEVWASSAAVAWDAAGNDGDTFYGVEASTAADFTGEVSSGTAVPATLLLAGLWPNTTYHFRANAVLKSTSAYGALGSTATLAEPVSGFGFTSVDITSVSVAWTALPPAPSSRTGEGYLLEASTAADFTGTVFSSMTPNAALGTLVVPGLDEFTTYYFRAGSLNWNSVPNFVSAGSTRTRAGPPPGAPLISQVFLSSAAVSWIPVPSDNGYVLEASTAADFSGTVLASATPNVALAGLAVSGLDPNTTYYLRAGSLWSGATNYAPTAPPSTSTLANAVTGPQFAGVFATSATVNWVGLPLSPPDASSKTAEGYLLQASTAADFTGALFSTATPNAGLSTLTVSGLNEFTTYYFRVGALNWNGVPSFIVAGTTRTRAGLAPASPAVAAVYHSSVSVAWGAVASDDGYVLEASTAADFSGTVASSATPNGALTGLIVLGLDPNTTYYLRAGAIWSGATSYALTAPQSTSTLANEVIAPQFAGVFATSAAVNWVGLPLSPPDASSKTAEGYLLQASTAPDFTGTLFSTATPNAGLSTLTVSGLNEFTTYYFRVGALNWNGAPSFIVAGTTRTRTGTFPGDPTLVSVFLTSAAVAWTPAASDDGYVLEASTAADFSGTLLASATPNGAAAGLSVEGLDPNTTYYLRAGSLWSGGTSYALSAPASTSTLTGAVSGPLFASVQRTSATMTWLPLPGGPQAASAEGYLLQASTAADFTGSVFSSATPNAALSTLAVQGLAPFTTYYFRLGALNWNSVPNFIAAGSTRTAPNLPPQDPLIAQAFAASIAASWGPVGATDGYILEASTASDFTGTLFSSATPNGSSAGLSVPGLAANTTYYLRAGALWGPATSYALTTPASTSTLADQASGLRLAAIFRSSAVLDWTALPPAPPAASAEGYLLEASTAADFTGALVSSRTPNVALSTLALAGLDANTTWYFRLGTLNWNSVAHYAPALSSATLTEPVSGVQLAAVFTSSAVVNWPALPGAPQAASAEGYVLDASTAPDFSGTVYSSRTPNVALSTLAVAGLDSGTTYYFRVGALNWNSVPSFAAAGSTRTGGALPPQGPALLAVFLSSVSVGYGPVGADAYVAEASTAPDFSGTVLSSAGPGGALSPQGLAADTTYYLRAGALWGAATSYTAVSPPSTSTLADLVSGPQIVAVFQSSAALNWLPAAAQGYVLEASTASDFSGTLRSSRTPSAALSTLTVSGLSALTTYYFRVGSLNWNSVPHYLAAGSTRTVIGPPPGSPALERVHVSSVSVVWGAVAADGGYVLEASTAADFSGTVFSSATPNGSAAGLAVQGLAADTTYYLRAGSLWNGAASYALSAPVSTATLAGPPSGLQLAAVFQSSAALNWVPVASEGYVLEASTAPDFSGVVLASATPSVGLSTLSIAGLDPNTTHYFRVGSLNWNGARSFGQPRSTSTLAASVSGLQAAAAFISSVTASWTALPASPQSASGEGYVLQASTTPDFSGTVASTSTPDRAQAALALEGLFSDATYYLRLGALNWNGVPYFTAFASTRTGKTEVTVRNFRGRSGFKTAVLEWDDLTVLEKGPLFVGYALYKAGAEAGPFVQLTTTTALAYTDASVLVGSTYYYRLSARLSPSFETSASTAAVFVVSSRPQPPASVSITVAGSSVTLSWMPVQAYENGIAFIAPAAPSPEELTRYRVYRATAAAKAPWTLAAMPSTGTLAWVDGASGPEYYYHVKGENVSGVSEISVVRAYGEKLAVVVAPDEKASLTIPAEQMRPLEGVGGDPATAYRLVITSRPQDLGGKVFRSVEITALRGGLTPEPGLQLPGQAILEIRYDQSGPLVTPSGLAPAAALPTPDNLTVYWNSGAKWLQLYGKNDAARQRIMVETKYVGVYQLRTGERVGAFTFDKAGLTNRLITPNGDRLNDWAVFIFDNPRGSEVTGRVFDLKGAEVSGMVPGPIADSLMWDGKSGGVVVPGGVYIYQISAEGETYTGTVVVVR